MPDACQDEAHDDECNKNARLLRRHSNAELIGNSKDEQRNALQLPGGIVLLVCLASVRQHWWVFQHEAPAFAQTGSRAWMLRSAGCARVDASGYLARLLLRSLLVARKPPALSGLVRCTKGGALRDQMTIGAHIGGTMRTIDIAWRRGFGRSFRSGANRSADRNGKREVPQFELEEVEIKATSNEGHACELT
ncbi:hypothetical protein [Bradyrhizobium acaciae]|nr:hypothetical protein [Bradyrhizobium acaciae]MCC8978102.1 hypothetical protein [Bradyrhizobium acaciae]